MRGRTLCLWIVCSVALVAPLAAQTPAAQRRNPPAATPELVLDLARDYALSSGEKHTDADVRAVRVLLRAAARLAPKSPDPWRLLCEVDAVTLGLDQIAEPLEKLLELDPGHEVAFDLWLDAMTRSQQSIDKQRAWLEKQLARDLPPRSKAMLRARLGAVALQQLDRARAHDEADAALQLWPDCPDAALLRVRLLTPDSPPADRLKVLLAALQTHSRDAQLAWDVGQLLFGIEAYADAQIFFDHALRMNGSAPPATALPIIKLNQISLNLYALGRTGEAIRLAERVLDAAPDSMPAMMHLFWLHSHGGESDRARQLKAKLDERVVRIADTAGESTEDLAAAAWYYLQYVPTVAPQRVLALSTVVSGRAPNDPFARRLMGWSLTKAGRSDEALDILRPIARDDPFAAAAVVKLLRERNESAAADAVIAELKIVPRVGPARVILDEVGIPMPTSMPASAPSDIADALRAFDGSVLSFDQDPSRDLEVIVEFEDPSPSVGEPWIAIFTLRNKGSYPIQLGPDALVNPSVLLSFHTEGDKPREFPGLFSIHLDRLRSLEPGASYRVRRSVDLGPLRRLSRATPQQLQRVTLTAILDAQMSPDGGWRPSAFGQMLRPAVLNRLPVQTSAAGLDAIFRTLKGDQPSSRLAAVETLGQLLGEAQRSRVREPGYRPGSVPEDRIEDALINALTFDAPELRVRALDALMMCGLSARLVAAVEANVKHDDWLIRLMAMRVLARQGDAFTAQLERIASDDADDTVRDFARAMLDVAAAKRETAGRPAPTSTPVSASMPASEP